MFYVVSLYYQINHMKIRFEKSFRVLEKKKLESFISTKQVDFKLPYITIYWRYAQYNFKKFKSLIKSQ